MCLKSSVVILSCRNLHDVSSACLAGKTLIHCEESAFVIYRLVYLQYHA
jgi:hypothetical protein